MEDNDVEVSELLELAAEKVSGVGSPANGTPWLLLKASDPGDPDAGETESSEADAIEDQVTKATDALCLLHDYAVKGVDADALGAVQAFVDGLGKEVVEKAKLKAKARNALSDSDFAYIDAKGGRHLPINDESHVRNALARFDQTHFDSEEDKAKAGRKIRSRAKSMGIDVSDDDNAAKGSPGVPDDATKTPTTNGRIAGAGRSGLGGPMTDGVRHPHSDPSFALGGESTYAIPADAQVTDNPPAPARIDRPDGEEVGKSWTIEIVDSAEKAGNWMSVDNMLGNTPSPDSGSEPGSPEWEAYDASSLDSVARGLAAASRAVTEIAQREATEAISGNSSDWFDAFDLGCAATDINQALGLVARLAYHEAAAEKEGAEKAGRRHSSKDEAMLRAARDHLNDLLGEPKTAEHGAKTSEEEEIMTTVTKEELAQTIAQASKEGFMEALKAQRKAAKKSAKAERKAQKNANNGGDISGEQERAGVHGEHDADDVASVGGGETPSVAKSEDKVLTEVLDKLAKMSEKVEKIASRPRSGGPVLDGVARGSFPAAEGRMTETVAKSEAETEIERLQKELDEVSKRSGPEAAAQASDISQVLTLKRLQLAHAQGRA